MGGEKATVGPVAPVAPVDPVECLTNMINPASCECGTVTETDANGCSSTTCKEDCARRMALEGACVLSDVL